MPEIRVTKNFHVYFITAVVNWQSHAIFSWFLLLALAIKIQITLMVLTKNESCLPTKKDSASPYAFFSLDTSRGLCNLVYSVCDKHCRLFCPRNIYNSIVCCCFAHIISKKGQPSPSELTLGHFWPSCGGVNKGDQEFQYTISTIYMSKKWLKRITRAKWGRFIVPTK